MPTYIIGHKKPDTDAVASAIAMSFLCDQLKCLNCKGAIPLISDPPNPETIYIFDKFSIKPPQLISKINLNHNDKFILVDHNESTQIPEGINSNQIVEVIDHHRVNLNLANPIFLTFKPWGSTSTIIHFIMEQNNVEPTPQIASLMLSAILSDTVGFKSSTCTQSDTDAAHKLAKLANIDNLDVFTLEIFKAKSDISSLTDDQIITNDYKIFNFNKKTFIGQLETVEQDKLLSTKKESLLKSMQNIKQKEDVELLFIAVTDILKINTKLLILSEIESNTAIKAFGGKVADNILDIGPIMSRKKDIAPSIEKALLN